MAILAAKLSWRLLHDDNSLFFRVFEARFFPNGTILYAKDYAAASFAWKSILKARELILKEALWRVGDGKQIKFGVTTGYQQKSNQKLPLR